MSECKVKTREGFSLVEMIIAIAIVGIVMSGVLLLISYSTNNMRRTNNMVQVQNETKDAMLHITTYLQESTDAYYDKDKKALIVVNETREGNGTVKELDVAHYWLRPIPAAAEGEPEATPEAENTPLVFLKNVTQFECCEGVSRVEVSDESSEEEGTPSGSGMTWDDGTRYLMCFYKKTYTDPDEVSHCYADGKINYAEDGVGLNYDEVYAPGSSESGGAETEDTEDGPDPGTDPAATPAPTPTIVKVGGKYMKVILKLESENGEAQFTSEKQVFLRNQ